MIRYQPSIIAPSRRFTYNTTSETRPQKAARTFRLAFGGITGERADLVIFPIRDPKSTALFLLGTAIGNLILNNYEKRKDGQNNLIIIPSNSRDSIGVALTMEF